MKHNAGFIFALIPLHLILFVAKLEQLWGQRGKDPWW